MLHQRYKDIVFWGISKATLPNYFLRRYVMSGRPANGACHLHLGCGTKYLAGFLNIDGNLFNKIDLWLDVRNGLPFRSNSVDSIYSTHMFEHFYPDELKRLLQECARVLKNGGGMRLVVPSLESAIAAYTQQRSEWFYDSFPRHFDSLGGRFSNFVFLRWAAPDRLRLQLFRRGAAPSGIPGGGEIRGREEPLVRKQRSAVRTGRLQGFAPFSVCGGV